MVAASNPASRVVLPVRPRGRRPGGALLLLATFAQGGCAGGNDAPGLNVLPSALVPSDDGPSLAKREAARAPEKPKVAPWAPAAPSWVFPLPADHGLRTDDGGQGQFLAPRAHGKHNGLDFLAPVGTPILAMCSGRARADDRGGYGRVVQLVCPMPTDLSGGDLDLHVSLFYAHLDKSSVPKAWKSVRAGQPLGTVGKTGNASGPKIKPHLHLEAVVRASEELALAEKHSGVDAKAARDADAFFEALEESCLEPANLRAKADIRRDRRVDPFVMLVCAGKPKPAFTPPEQKPLRDHSVAWSRFYSSEAFDVDRGPRPLAKAKAPEDPDAD